MKSVRRLQRMQTHLVHELAAYEKEKQRLVAEANEKFVLIKGDDVVNIFVSQEDALNEGYKQFGNTEFLVKQIVAREKFNYFTRTLV